MSSIDKMSVQGIRSFGPRDQDTQMIQFFAPVTLIVGPNGSGKTTIIECLKYATTGDLPPNSKGGAFVFDPKLLDEVETKGKIKLFIKDIKLNNIQVQKNLSVTQKAKKIEFRTLETIISRYNKDYNLLSTVTSKCINTDYEIINALGVSKAVLDNVIFCHQEDSNWPLSDPKTLKTKFDDIFSATKYIKTLDQLRKIRLEKQQLIKQQDIEKKHLEVYKQRSDELKQKLNDYKSKYDIYDMRVDSIKSKLEPIDSKLNELNEKSLQIYELQRKYDTFDSEKVLLEKQIQELNEILIKSATGIFKGSDEELEDYTDSFLLSFSNINKNISEKTQQISKKESEYKQNSESKSKLLALIGGLENEEKFYQRNKQLFKSKCDQLHAEMGVEANQEMIETNEGINEKFINKLNTSYSKYKSDYENETKSVEEKELSKLNLIEKSIQENRDKKSKIDQLLTNKLESIDLNKIEINKIEKDLKQFDSNLKQLDLIDKEINKKQIELDQLNESIDFTKLDDEITELSDKRFKLNSNLNKINHKIDKLHEQTELKTRLDMLNKDKKLKNDNIFKIRQRYYDDFLQFFNNDSDKYDNIDNSKLKQHFDSELKQQNHLMEQLQSKNKDLNKQLGMIESKRKLLNDDLRKKESESRDYEDKLHQIDDIKRFDQQFKDIQDKLSQLSDEKGFLKRS